MTRPIPELQIRRRDVPPHADDDFRNMLTYQSAIIRGQNSVVFNNADSLKPEMADRVRTFIPGGHPPNQPWNWLFGQYKDPQDAGLGERESVREIMADQPWEGFELEWVKVLGEGGFGLATLWKVHYDDDSYEYVVIKIPHSTDITGEAEWHLRYKGASHIVQFLDIQEKAREIRREHFPGQAFQWEEDFDWREMNVVLLEYAEYGSVYEMMQKASYFKINFPNRCLWEIWECLVKAVASAAWQPHLAQNDPSFLERALRSYDDPSMGHYSDFLKDLPVTHDVHFDLEEQNILIADDFEHHYHPIFKLHDFGEFSHKMRRCWRDWREKDYWRCRKTPKKNRMAPETFSADWDEIAMGAGVDGFKGEDLTRGHPVAGRYGAWTNLFHIGQVMLGIITKVYAFHPMNAGLYPNNDGTQTDATYGWRLMRPAYADVELDLKDLIMQCMYEKPSSRPTLDYLLKKIAARKARGFHESPDQVRRFWEDFANLRRGAQQPPPDDDDDDDDDNEGGAPPHLSQGSDGRDPTDPKTLVDSRHSQDVAMATAREQPEPNDAEDGPGQRQAAAMSSYSLGSAITSATDLATSEIRDRLVAQFTSFPSSSETFVSCTEEPVRSSPLGKRKIRLLDDDDYPAAVPAKRSRLDDQIWGGNLVAKTAQLGRGMRERLGRLNIDSDVNMNY